ncbi:hypothetical protein ElyMa_003709000 [Elysia marginata]|uniref:Uncharacterized protein n=1 Tax=Elysia marginata TaxID=1093978 RepID=A0AAV4F2F3_9GAST|nr:hypothetical protein ElyMa_003709000 [Elysia marginata]
MPFGAQQLSRRQGHITPEASPSLWDLPPLEQIKVAISFFRAGSADAAGVEVLVEREPSRFAGQSSSLHCPLCPAVQLKTRVT